MAYLMTMDGDITFTVSQANLSDNKIMFEMIKHNVEPSFYIDLELNDLIELQKWLSTQINVIQENINH